MWASKVKQEKQVVSQILNKTRDERESNARRQMTNKAIAFQMKTYHNAKS